jgi:hypothetical protein
MSQGKYVFFKSNSVYDKREPHLKQMMFRSFGIAC